MFLVGFFAVFSVDKRRGPGHPGPTWEVALERSLGLKASYTHESATEESWGIPVDSWKALKRITYICRYHIYICIRF